jgi:hypothetical protein
VIDFLQDRFPPASFKYKVELYEIPSAICVFYDPQFQYLLILSSPKAAASDKMELFEINELSTNDHRRF